MTRNVRAPVDVLIVGPTPPPYHGVAMAIDALLSAQLGETCTIHHVELADRRGIGHVNQPDWHDVVLFLGQWRDVVARLIRQRPAVVYFVLSQTTVGILRDSLLMWPAIVSGAKVVTHLHGGALQTWYRSRWWPMRYYTRCFLRRMSRALVLGESLREAFDGLVPPARVTVVPNGISDHWGRKVEAPRPPGQPWRVLYLNTLNKMKGALLFLEAVALVSRERRDVEFIFAGPWSHERHRQEAEAYIAQQGIESCVRFLGQVAGAQKIDVLCQADVFVFPGLQQEGQPLVVLEAMAAGLPIVFTARGCLRETLRDGEEGLEVPVGDAAALAQRMLWLLERPEEMRRLGRNARARYERTHTLASHLDRMATLFQEVAFASVPPQPVVSPASTTWGASPPR